ncbi:glycosyltransferase family 4 protein [Pseudoflavitalea sp. G-6-1-2]|uniref:glycosyltransferase family 4 protein n=1 Tax=Pseudoflavitalea sp. G-6-1-2 TaxID=2728841 RepID=UPI001469B6B7|nr:glycosyltransferase family 4 protein [Pseudoflavitalea sp. G-6-1-2]NML21826.1 glycosyltransferase family 4 protein [Pseudoflavitalea sp. G-6-1-2]
MKAGRKKMVVLAHDASLSGAPVLLYNLLLLLKQSDDIEISLMAIQRPGPLLPQFEQHFPVLLLKPAGYAKEGSIPKRLIGIIRNRIRLMKLMRKAAAADLIFSNTIVNGDLLKTMSFLRKKSITYVHELEQVLAFYAQTGQTTNTLQYSTLLAYPSMKVKQVLQQQYGVADQKLGRLSYYMPVNQQQLQPSASRADFVQHFKTTYGLQNAGMLVVGMGKIGRRKGTDIFVHICELVSRQNKDIRFCWIGDAESSEEQESIHKLVAEKQLDNQLVFTGALAHDYYNLAAFDIFLLSSREDPYPLVVLEAALMGVPSICFAESGGIAEFVGADAGWTIPGFDVEQAAASILQLYHQKEVRIEKGNNAREKALRQHVNPELVKEQFNVLLKQGN